MLAAQLFGLFAVSAGLAGAVDLTGYEYIVVGSGAGGGPLAARLALAGRKTLLIEAGDDQGQNINYTVPAYSAKVSEDPALAWNFFVRHYADDARQALDYKTTYRTEDGSLYTGLDPPPNSTMLGTLYPRTGSLGGCTSHNAMIAVYPYMSDFDSIANLTGDASWSADNMRKYFVKLERNQYQLLPIDKSHGYGGWLGVEEAPLTIALKDPDLLSLILGGAFALGNLVGGIFNIFTLLLADANENSRSRDEGPGYYQIPISTDKHARNGAREFVVQVRDAKNPDGSQKYPLDVRTNCFVTKVVFDNSSLPRATGVEFLDGAYLYRASPRSQNAGRGTPGTAAASREVIVAGGTYNSPQLLKLSGIGPAAELQKFNIPVVSNLAGVGGNLQDHYEIAVQGQMAKNFSALNGCTFTGDPTTDPCLRRWQNPVLGDRGIYSSGGFASAMYYRSSASTDGNFDMFVFGGPVNFRGYFPGYSVNATAQHNLFTWAILKGHPRNRAGTVTLRSADPLDVPDITYNYFDTGSGDSAADLQAIYEAVGLARNAFSSQLSITEVLPGASITSKADIQTYIKNTAWGHHASCTCPIGPDNDPMAVLDSSFRVRGVQGLRVVDASVYPRIPGVFTAVSTYMVAEKAADVILSQISK